MSISFNDEDFLLGSKLDNRPLYVLGYVWEQKLNQILIDNGSAVNIIPKSTMNQLRISVEVLSNSKLVIQGFNQGAQQAIGTVRLEIVIGDLQASTIFHGIRKVDVDTKPFTKAESHFADAKFYTKSEDVSEVISTEVLVTKGTFKNEPGLSPTQKKLQKQGYFIPNSRAGVGYQSSEPVRIAGKGKVKVANTCHITVEENKDSKEGEKDRSQRSSVFDHITFSATRPSVFQRVSTLTAEDKNQASTCGSTRLSAFQKLNTTAKKVQSISPTLTTKKSTFKRLSLSVTRGQKKAFRSVPSKSGLVTRDEEIRSAVSSRMKRKMFILVNTEGSLKVKRHDVVFTQLEDNEPEDKVDVAGCCHVTIEETSDHDIFEEDAEVTPLSLEDGGQIND
ncbi:gag protease polyprotein [Cucumis melo var. makuwa]|nr:gag protease polyprotein [Cucumis melo var. makuwa]